MSLEHWLLVLLDEHPATLNLLSETPLDIEGAAHRLAAKLGQTLLPPEVRALQNQLADLEVHQEAAINDDEYERAALRDQSNEVEQKLAVALKTWRAEP